MESFKLNVPLTISSVKRFLNFGSVRSLQARGEDGVLSKDYMDLSHNTHNLSAADTVRWKSLNAHNEAKQSCAMRIFG